MSATKNQTVRNDENFWAEPPVRSDLAPNTLDNYCGISRNRREVSPNQRAYHGGIPMNPLTVTLLVVIAFFAAIASLVLAVAIARAQDGYQDETGFHRGMAPWSARPVVIGVRITYARQPTGMERTPAPEPASLN